MKAYVYTVFTGGNWLANFTIEPEADRLYWLDDRFRAELAALGYPAAHEPGETLWLWREPLPLGDAARAARLWNGGAGPSSGKKRRERNGGQRPAASEALGLLAASVDMARREAAGAAGVERGEAKPHRPGRDRPPEPAAAGPERRAERWTRAALAGERGAAAAGEAAAQARALAAAALRAAAALQGRALLRGEAHALLYGADAAAHGAPPGAGSALQLAALLGRLRLQGAVAAAPGGPRRFALLRRSKRECRCLRCGSGEAHMRRTACASCGRMCAYCSACLGMGRSRECELLILGMPSQAPAGGEPLPPPAGRLARWGLSPAQTAAAGAALRFAEAPASRSAGSASSAPDHHAAAVRRDAVTYAGSASPAPAHHAAVRRDAVTYAGSASPAADHHAAAVRRDAVTYAGAAAWPAAVRREAARSSAVSALAGTSLTSPPCVAAYPALASPEPPRQFLLWAVTGAGKTEMIFPLVESILLRGGRALIATPRRDVVLELDPRIRKAFPEASVVTLYGGSEQRWEAGDITLSTTHQLLRFHQAFQLVIIDELDAFPYHGDPMLHYAADKCCAPGAVRMLLSATPPPNLQREARSGKLPHAKVPVRYHRHPLPVPRLLRTPPVQHMLKQRRLPAELRRAMRSSLDRGAQLFVFVQRIAQTGPMADLLIKELGERAVLPVSSLDPERPDKVQRFRRRELRIIVTTTILERGVTVPKSDVYILDADGRLFDSASLVQMAGRAGRSADDPGGFVYFCAKERNAAQLTAVRQIRSMNRIAGDSGYLLPGQSDDAPKRFFKRFLRR